MKKFILGLICGLFLMGSVFAATELNIVANPFPILIDDIASEVEGYNINGYTFLKLADFKQAGLTVKFNETDSQIEITTQNNTTTGGLTTASTASASIDFSAPEIKMEIGKPFTINGKTYVLDEELIKNYGITNISENGFESEFPLDLDIVQYDDESGVHIVKYNGVEYVKIANVLEIDGIHLTPDTIITSVISIVNYNNNVQINNIPTIEINNKKYIPYTYVQQLLEN